MPISGLIADPASTRGLSQVCMPITGFIAGWPVTWPVLLTMPLSVQSVPVRELPPRVPAGLETWGLRVDRPLEALRSGAWPSQMVLDWESVLLRTNGGCLGSMAVPMLVAPMLRPGVSLVFTSLKEGIGMASCLSLVEAVEEGPESTRCKSVSGA